MFIKIIICLFLNVYKNGIFEKLHISVKKEVKICFQKKTVVILQHFFRGVAQSG